MMNKHLLPSLALLLFAVAAGAQDLYWEPPVLKAPAGVAYSASVANDEMLAVSWQERTGSGSSSAVSLWMDAAYLDAPNTDTRWTGRRLVYGPIPLVGAGEEGRMHSLALDGTRVLAAVVLPSMSGLQGSEVLIVSSEDGGGDFRVVARFRAATFVTSPDLSRTADGGWLLMLRQPEQIVGEGTQAAQGKLSIAYSHSPDGVQWSALRSMVTESTLTQNIQPHHVAMGAVDYVVFQSKRVTNHLYVKRSFDGGRSWDEPSIPVTPGDEFAEAAAGKVREPDEFNNQRPFLATRGDRLALAWERSLVGSDQAQIYYCEIDGDGRVIVPKEQVSRAQSALYPQLLAVGGELRLLYAEVRIRQARLMIASRTAADGVGVWSATAVAPSLVTSGLMPHGAVLKNRPYAFAEALSAKNAWALYAVRPDTSVAAPRLVPVDFQQGEPSNRSTVDVRWDEPADSSRVAGYRYRWSKAGGDAGVVELAGASQRLTLGAPDDGSWTLSVWSVDRAGNISLEPARLSYLRDATPPGPVALYLQPAPLPSGYLASNDFTISWAGPEGDLIARYEVSAPFSGDPGSIERRAQSIRARNVDDGEYTVTVAAVDRAGNIGPSVAISVRLNRYRLVTYIARIDRTRDTAGNLVLSLVGRGFAAGGAVPEVYLDRDGAPPYDYTLRLASRQYEVSSDRLIRGVTLGADYESGSYLVGVKHAVRGIHFAGQPVAFEAPGTVKIGDFRFRYLPRWAAARSSPLHLPFVALLVAACAGMVALLLVASSRQVVATAREGAVVASEVRALLDGRPSRLALEDARRKLRKLNRRGIGLSLKFSLLVSVLTVLVVAGVAVPLSLQMMRREQRILAVELQNRANLLLDASAARAAAPLRAAAGGFAAAANIPSSISAMPGEARYLTITGPRVPAAADDAADRDYLWATNDPSWPAGSYDPAILPLDAADLTAAEASRITKELNAAVAATLADDLRAAEALKAESERLLAISLLATATDAQVKAYEAKAQEETRKRNEIRRKILDLATRDGRAGSIPPFDPDRLEREYTFYRPIADYIPGGPYALGMVRLRVSTARINENIAAVRSQLFVTMSSISLAAVAVGIVGAVVLAGITIRPVKKLAAGVAVIRDTEDKRNLPQIDIATRDEIGTLADSVNEMSRGLVQAAIDKAELLVGKEVQKRFLPLEEVAGEKGSTGGLKTDRLDIYGYYEGAKSVSGDYFDFQRLDDRHYAVINCDVSGKGVPAAMIMVEVATLFLGWCRDWTRERRGGRDGADDHASLGDLVYTINDMLEERGFKGRFAALTVALYDLDTGIVTVCTAGNNVLYVYDADRRAVIPHPLPQTPAAGVFPSMLVEAKSGFPQLRLPLERGDALFLFTDGFEESKRSFRTFTGDVVRCAEPGLKEGEVHLGSHAVGQTDEEFGIPRITGVVNAVFGRSVYRLERHHAPAREDLEFDFSTCTGTVKEAVLALVSVEKVFRIYRDALTGPTNRVRVEKKVDEFLAQHFRQYRALFDHRTVGGTGDGTVVFTHLKEDPQYDDLTLLVVRRP